MDGDIFDWKSVLGKECQAAKVTSMKHAPAAQIWNGYVKPRIKLVFRHEDTPPNPSRRKQAYWIVTILKVQGYYCHVRYEGKENGDNDFWIHIGKDPVFPVGVELKNMVFAPPKCLSDRSLDWRTCFMNSLPDAETLPRDFFLILRRSIPGSKYRVGHHLEVIDKYKISQLRIARVSKIIGRRMYLRYLDDYSDGISKLSPNILLCIKCASNNMKIVRNISKGFFCHEQSSLIHSLGWAACVGHNLKVPPNFEPETGIKPPPSKICEPLDTTLIKEGMKLEAVDPLCPSRICAASICKVLEFGYMMIKMDCYEESKSSPKDGNESDNDWFCYHLKSPYIFECGFCQANGIPFLPPYGKSIRSFSWNDYLKEKNCVAAGIPPKTHLHHDFSVGMKLEMVDVMTPMKIHVATIVQVAGRLLRIKFDGWEPDFDQWLDAESPDIFPIGWCALVGHQLEGPKTRSR